MTDCGETVKNRKAGFGRDAGKNDCSVA